MLISGNEPSSVIISQTKTFQKCENGAPEVPKQAEAPPPPKKKKNVNEF